MSRRIRNSIIISLLLHAVLFAVIAFQPEQVPGEGEEPPSEQQQATPEALNVEIVDPPKLEDKEVAPPKDEESGDSMSAPSHLDDQCAEFFGGIGITQSTPQNQYGFPIEPTVTEVHKGYPAEKAGIQVGDILMNSEEIRGEIGTTVTVPVMRNGQIITFKIIRDKICTTPPKEKP